MPDISLEAALTLLYNFVVQFKLWEATTHSGDMEIAIDRRLLIAAK